MCVDVYSFFYKFYMFDFGVAIAFVNGTRMSGICAFVSGCFECEQKSF